MAEENKFRDLKRESETRLNRTNIRSALISYQQFLSEYKESLWKIDPDDTGTMTFSMATAMLHNLHMLNSESDADEAWALMSLNG